ncbi:MAG: tyrosine--tRNA ligase [Calditrichaeota bacterium]|nr:tyrosine--tRNA ligase [Calditrichota bacterium]
MRTEQNNAYEVLKQRGFVSQVTDEAAVRAMFEAGQVTCYIGFDPTADSLHVGSLLPIMALVHVQRAGHRPIAVIGGGTAMVGDPSGKTEMRQMLSRERIHSNGLAIRAQLDRYLHFSDGGAIAVDNYEWLSPLNYIEFLRDIGRHFSVNRMLTAEAYRQRLETGLSFIEFNYQILQAYDFLVLFRRYGCTLQMGGDDQWGNILAGVDLIRRLESAQVEGVTFPLLTTATGEKMGKTARGAVWLDPRKTSPYEFYQYWVNVDDRDVARFLAYFTLLPLQEIEQIQGLAGADLNLCKVVLAYEATKITHGEEEARRAFGAASSAFGARIIPAELLPSSTVPRGEGIASEEAIPTTAIARERLDQGIWIVELLTEVGLARTRSEARRLIEQRGAYLNQQPIDSLELRVGHEHFTEGMLMLRAGKKRYHRLVLA